MNRRQLPQADLVNLLCWALEGRELQDQRLVALRANRESANPLASLGPRRREDVGRHQVTVPTERRYDLVGDDARDVVAVLLEFFRLPVRMFGAHRCEQRPLCRVRRKLPVEHLDDQLGR